jgi:hypothetical protein
MGPWPKEEKNIKYRKVLLLLAGGQRAKKITTMLDFVSIVVIFICL